MSDRRDQQLHFRVSKPELERIHSKMAELGILSIGAYLRKMALDGYAVRLDLQGRLDELIDLAKQILAQLAVL